MKKGEGKQEPTEVESLSINIQRVTNYSLAAIFAALLVTSGCADRHPMALSESMAVTFSQPAFWLEPGAQLSWHSELVYLYADARKQPEDVRAFLQQEVETYFTELGYPFSADKTQSKYRLLAVMVLGEGMTAHEILKRYQLTPAFKATRRYEKGTILVAVLNNDDLSILWRGALQANVDISLPAQQRQARVREGIHRLLAHLPRQRPTD